MVKRLEADENRAPDDRDLVLAKASRSLALMRLILPVDEEIEKGIRETYNDISRTGMGDYPIGLAVCQALADYLDKRGRFQESQQFFRRAKVCAERSFGPEHPMIIGIIRSEATVLGQEI
ncbi:hypothetical protein F4677DRAFT_436326 [Hypoxylon crocopeplum]|nr:hypothetical protein F4677DRAFT_436326 [Hypoxylon crocopeplum]